MALLKLGSKSDDIFRREGQTWYDYFLIVFNQTKPFGFETFFSESNACIF
jgi:hypothetical protein